MILVQLLATAIKYIMMNHSVEIPGDLLLLQGDWLIDQRDSIRALPRYYLILQLNDL